MALSEVKRFIKHIEKNRKLHDSYNVELTDETRWGLYTEPTVISTGYYASPMLPEKLQEDLLQRIIELDEKSGRKLEKLCTTPEEKITLKNRMVKKFDDVKANNQTQKEVVLTRDEIKRQKLFSRLSELARADGFDISTDDLLFYIGKAVMVVIKEHPDYTESSVFDAVLGQFE